jgi:hypothetical protein
VVPFWHFTCILVRIYCILTNGRGPRRATGAVVPGKRLDGPIRHLGDYTPGIFGDKTPGIFGDKTTSGSSGE